MEREPKTQVAEDPIKKAEIADTNKRIAEEVARRNKEEAERAAKKSKESKAPAKAYTKWFVCPTCGERTKEGNKTWLNFKCRTCPGKVDLVADYVEKIPTPGSAPPTPGNNEAG